MSGENQQVDESSDGLVRPHGQRAKYVVEKCHCPACTAANTLYEAQRSRKHLYGIDILVDPSRAKTKIAELRALGVGTTRIAELSGLHRTRLQDIASGAVERIRPETEKAILGIDETDIETLAADGARIDATKTWRRIDALQALGYPKSWIAESAGLGASIQIARDVVSAGNARKIRALAEHVGNAPGPSQRTRLLAERKGYRPPSWYGPNFELPVPVDTSQAPFDEAQILSDDQRRSMAAITRRMIAEGRPVEEVMRLAREAIRKQAAAKGIDVVSLSEPLNIRALATDLGR